MEFAAAALTAVATAGEAAIGAAGTAATTIGSAVSGAGAGISGLFSSIGGMSSTVGSILSGGATIASVLNAKRAGEQQADYLNMQAADAEMQIGLEQNQGIERRTQIKAALLQALGERDVAAAASGVDLSFGTPAVARRQAQDEGERALNVDQQTQDFRTSRLLERSARYKKMAVEARAGGLGKAAALALEGGAKLFRRG